MPLNESEFQSVADALMVSIEDAIIDTEASSDVDIDCELVAGVLTLTLENNGSKIIVSRQPATAQIWVAAKSGGYHFVYQDETRQWQCTTTDEPLPELLLRVLQEQGADLAGDLARIEALQL